MLKNNNNNKSLFTISLGRHNPSPYLRRYRLPTINSEKSMAAYDELLSPADEQAKLATITSLNLKSQVMKFGTNQVCEYLYSTVLIFYAKHECTLSTNSSVRIVCHLKRLLAMLQKAI